MYEYRSLKVSAEKKDALLMTPRCPSKSRYSWSRYIIHQEIRLILL